MSSLVPGYKEIKDITISHIQTIVPGCGYTADFNTNVILRKLLNYKPEGNEIIYPITIPCKICKSLLNIYNDSDVDIWLHCAKCDFAGDIIEYLGKLWKYKKTSSIIKKLDNMKLSELMIPAWAMKPSSIRQYEKRVTEFKALVNDYYKELTTRPFRNNPYVVQLHNDLGICSTYDTDRWNRQMQQFFGLEKTRRVLRVSSEYITKEILNNNIPEQNYICTIFHDLPGRISGFLYTSRAAKYPSKEWYFKSAKTLSKLKTEYESTADFQSILKYKDQKFDAGVAFYEAACGYNNFFPDEVFVTLDPMLAFKLHSRWYMDHSDYLPLVLALDTDYFTSTHVWQNLPDKKYILIGTEANKELFNIAANIGMGTKIYIGPIDETDIKNYTILLSKIQENAKPWYRVFDDTLTSLKKNEFEEYLLHLKYSRERWDILLVFIKKNYQKVKAFLNKKPKTRSLSYFPRSIKDDIYNPKIMKFVITESREGWTTNAGDTICNARIYLDKIDRDMKYHFVAKMGLNQLIKLTLTYDQAKKNLAKILEKEFLKQHQLLLKINPFWEGHLFEITKQFSVKVKIDPY